MIERNHSEDLHWKVLGDPPPQDLKDARLQLHYALQLVTAVGLTFVDPQDDWSHISTQWDHSHGGILLGRQTRLGIRAALRPSDLTLLLLDEDGETVRQEALEHRTLDQAYDWLSTAITSVTGHTGSSIREPDSELPFHRLKDGAPFAFDDRPAFAEISRWFHNAALILEQIRSREEHASLVRCWSHHFDIATLVSLDPQKDSESARSIGLGMQPGDSSYPEPYYYVTPWPYPQTFDLPTLGANGHWHTSGWVGAVLTASSVTVAGIAAAQVERTAAFLGSALGACRELLS